MGTHASQNSGLPRRRSRASRRPTEGLSRRSSGASTPAKEGDQRRDDKRSTAAISPATSGLLRRSAPDAVGLYRPSDEHDACGVGFVAHIKGQRSHHIVRQALDLLINLEHRGACGSDPNTGDGAGILVQMPDAFLRQAVPFSLPAAGAYGAGLVFLPTEDGPRAELRAFIERVVAEEGQTVLGWRPVPTNLAAIGVNAAAVAPVFEQVFVGSDDSTSCRAMRHNR